MKKMNKLFPHKGTARASLSPPTNSNVHACYCTHGTCWPISDYLMVHRTIKHNCVNTNCFLSKHTNILEQCKQRRCVSNSPRPHHFSGSKNGGVEDALTS